MKLETDVNRIQHLAALREEQNWRFRSFLKGCDLSIEELDAIVHLHYKVVVKSIDCRTCGNCCRQALPILSRTDIKRLASHLKISKKELVDGYLSAEEDPGTFSFRSTPCPFLKENLCTVYSARPHDCRSYPHLHKKEFVFRLIQVVDNCAVCPIVFNVFERLKAELWHRATES